MTCLSLLPLSYQNVKCLLEKNISTFWPKTSCLLLLEDGDHEIGVRVKEVVHGVKIVVAEVEEKTSPIENVNIPVLLARQVL